jgi:hypothetical protein
MWLIADLRTRLIRFLGRYQVLGVGVRAVPGLGTVRARVARGQAGMYLSNQVTSRVR